MLWFEVSMIQLKFSHSLFCSLQSWFLLYLFRSVHKVYLSFMQTSYYQCLLPLHSFNLKYQQCLPLLPCGELYSHQCSIQNCCDSLPSQKNLQYSLKCSPPVDIMLLSFHQMLLWLSLIPSRIFLRSFLSACFLRFFKQLINFVQYSLLLCIIIFFPETS